jgi:hypothetical protein
MPFAGNCTPNVNPWPGPGPGAAGAARRGSRLTTPREIGVGAPVGLSVRLPGCGSPRLDRRRRSTGGGSNAAHLRPPLTRSSS